MRRRRARTLGLLAAAIALPACDGATASVGVGVAVPAPWGMATVHTAVPVGPYPTGRYGSMW